MESGALWTPLSTLGQELKPTFPFIQLKSPYSLFISLLLSLFPQSFQFQGRKGLYKLQFEIPQEGPFDTLQSSPYPPATRVPIYKSKISPSHSISLDGPFPVSWPYYIFRTFPRDWKIGTWSLELGEIREGLRRKLIILFLALQPVASHRNTFSSVIQVLN